MHGEAYGTVKAFNSEAAHTWAEAGFPRAYLTFKAQLEIAYWLDAVIDTLIKDAGPSGNTEWAAMVAGGLHSSYEEGAWSPYHLQEFAPPSTFDLKNIVRKVRDHLNMILDEMELMQTSVEHMRQYVLEMKANTCFNYDGTRSAEEEWAYIARAMTTSWINDICRWQRVVVECEHLQMEVTKSRSVLVPGTRLSQDTATAVRGFGATVHGLLATAAVEYLPRFRSVNIIRDYLIRADQRKKTKHLRKGTNLSDDLDPKKQSDRVLYWAEDMEQAILDRKPGGVSWHVRKVKEELRGAAYSRDLENWMSGLALMDEIALLWSWRQTLDYCNPRDVAAGVRLRDMLPSNFEYTSKQTIDALYGGQGDRESGELLRRFCELPLPKGPKDLSWLDKMTGARKSLTDVWNSIRNIWDERQKGIERSETMRQAVLAQMSFDLSPEHLVRVNAERQQIQDMIRGAKALRERREQESQFVQQEWDLGANSDNVVRRNLTRKSNAARKNAMVGSALDKLTLNNNENVGPAFPPVQQIHIKPESLSVISKMFPTGAESSSSVRWTQLVQALTDAGLTATQGAGSAVSFAGQRGSVTIHQPHDRDGPNVDAIMLRGLGRRFNKWFGWTSETFVLREKGDKES